MSGTDKEVVYVGLSGGVDSAVAAMILRDAGYQVRGIHLRLWEPERGIASDSHADDLEATRKVAGYLGIPLEILDWRDRFREQIVGYYLNSLASGRTPNPCIYCNRQIKWGALLDYTLSRGASCLASGHYARLLHKDDLIELHKGFDVKKDQSYFLAQLSQSVLQKMILPLGDLSKDQVRAMAAEAKIPVASRKDSEDLCFLTGETQESFLRKYAPELLREGAILDMEGKKLGTHLGLPLYTIGQRKGIRIAADAPLYVTGKQIELNQLIVGRADSLAHDEIFCSAPNWLAGSAPDFSGSFQVKVRASARPLPATFRLLGRDGIIARLNQKLRDITPGQVLVIYQESHCLGSAEILSSGSGT